MNVGNIRLYKQFIRNIEGEEKQAVESKKWTELAKLESKKHDLEVKIEELENKN